MHLVNAVASPTFRYRPWRVPPAYPGKISYAAGAVHFTIYSFQIIRRGGGSSDIAGEVGDAEKNSKPSLVFVQARTCFGCAPSSFSFLLVLVLTRWMYIFSLSSTVGQCRAATLTSLNRTGAMVTSTPGRRVSLFLHLIFLLRFIFNPFLVIP
ncbi:hypothetical protein R3P38DRAFT_1697427 [Favolaschia claudopus]|uniref:Uncharacterized protein n=1 Tax=Favolaschia claudopus TaxID=2862362 RepID=A0AAW0ADC3_9AGAR